VKECSAYFPGDLAAYGSRVGSWLQLLSENGFQVVLATVVPVTRSRAARDPGKQESLLAYNQWVRQCAAQRHLLLLDLEAVLRGPDTYLRDELSAEDGSHLNANAYALLDAALLRLVSTAYPKPAEEAAEAPTR
jgi:lysophospholipase L1-like esterase